jgi:hypothetical protein
MMRPGRHFRCGRVGPTPLPAPGAGVHRVRVLTDGSLCACGRYGCPDLVIGPPRVADRRARVSAVWRRRAPMSAVWQGMVLCLVSAVVSAGLIVLLVWAIGHVVRPTIE